MGGSRLDSRKSRVHGTIGRKKAAKSGADCHSVNLTFPGGRRKDDSMGKTIVVCSNDDCVYRGDNGECGKDIIYLDDLGTCEDSE